MNHRERWKRFSEKVSERVKPGEEMIEPYRRTTRDSIKLVLWWFLWCVPIGSLATYGLKEAYKWLRAQPPEVYWDFAMFLKFWSLYSIPGLIALVFLGWLFKEDNDDDGRPYDPVLRGRRMTSHAAAMEQVQRYNQARRHRYRRT